jgi:translation elongation factor EF-G
MKQYHVLLTDGSESVISSSSAQQNKTSATTSFPEGWALKANRKAARFSDAQRQYLEDKFNIGQVSGQKQDPNAVSRDMRFAHKPDGTKLFSSDEYLSPQQVQSFFSRTAAKVRNTEYSEEEQVAAQKEKTYEELRQEIIEKVGLCHPISYDNLHLCAMAKGNRLTQLSIAMLNTICEFFDIPTEDFNNKRKKEYIEALDELILACDCNK